MEAKDLLIYILTKQFNKSEDEVKSALFDAEGNVLETAAETIGTMDAVRVGKLKGDGKQSFNQGYAKAKEEERKAAAKQVKEAFDIDSDSDVLDEVLETGKDQIAEKTKAKVIPPTEEQVKKEKWFIEFEKSRVPKSEYEKVTNEYNQFKMTIEEEKTFSTIRERAMAALKKMNPNFEMYKDNPEILETLTNSFINSLKEYKYKVEDAENILILKPNGDRLDNVAGWPETIDSLVAQKATKYFTFLKQKPKASASNEGGDPGKDGKEGKATLEWKTLSEYNAYMRGLDNSPEGQKKQVEAMRKYKEMVQKGELAE